MLLQLAILGVGAWLVIEGDMTAGMIFASSIVSGRALQPIDQLIAGWRQISEGLGAWRRVRTSYLDGKRHHAVKAKVELPEPRGAVRLENVIYSLPGTAGGGQPVIKRLSLDIAPGQSLGIIGPSRAGKTTLARLFVGAISPDSGAIRIDGADLPTWREEQRPKLFGYLPQDIQLCPGTIAENISRFDPEARDTEIVAAAQRAHAHELILLQRGGYQTAVGPMGNSLSGGERQRIALARAYYGDPKILVLDEPNANLDSDGEAALMQSLADAKDRGITVIIVTHRLSIAAACDRTLLLRDGLIEKIGPSAEVLRSLAPARPGGDPRQPSGRILPVMTLGGSELGKKPGGTG